MTKNRAYVLFAVAGLLEGIGTSCILAMLFGYLLLRNDVTLLVQECYGSDLLSRADSRLACRRL